MRARLIILITLMFMYGCDAGNVRGPETTVPRDAKAVELYRSGEYDLAAAEYLSLAETYRDSTQMYQLSAADAYIQDRKYEQAASLIGKLDPEPEDIAEQVYRDLLNARLALARHRTEQAEKLLQRQIPADLPSALLAGWYDTLSSLYELQNRPVEALLARIFLEEHLHSPALVDENSDRIWELLNRIGPDQISHAVPTPPINLRPWLELASLNKALQEGKTDPETALRTWSAAYPDHPANRIITSRILAASRDLRTLPAHIALLLPLTGAYQDYSEKIRDGFLSAWFSEKSYKPVVRIYDTDSTSFQQVYHSAVQSGADFVVGPLQKEAVQVLTTMQPVPVRTLALNQIEPPPDVPVNTAQPDLPFIVQFGLPPEDEAREVARRGILEGYTRVLIIAATGEFESRVVSAFSEEWARLGGSILERVDYEGRTEDFITPVKQLLNIDSSEARISLLRQRLGRSMNVTGRLRNDADFIFMVAPNLTARQIVPHLRFFRAGAIPVYSISAVYNGTPDPQTDVDLNGVEFVDMPWLLGNSRVDAGREQPAIADMSLPRYYAFGIDAFRLIPHLRQLAIDHNNRFNGATGELYLTDQGMIRRAPVWARFVDGSPQPVETGVQPR